MELFDIDEEDLGVLLAPWYREYENMRTGSYLPEEERYWEIHVHARDLSELRDPGSDVKYSIDDVIEFAYDAMDAEEMLEVEYPLWTETFEDRFPEAEIHYPEPDL